MHGQRRIFLTGATGFIGMPFAEALALSLGAKGEDYLFAVLSRGSKGTPYDQRIPVSGQMGGKVIFVEGDVTKPGFGMNDKALALARSCQEVWHMAASTEFPESKRGETFSINLHGTANAIELFEDSPSLEKFFYVGTAYSAGISRIVLDSEPLKEPEGGFRNPYEESKFHAEKAVAASGLPYVILAPSIVIGDLKTGKANTRKMVYGVIEAYARAKMIALRNCGGDGQFFGKGPGLIAHGRYETAKNYIGSDDAIRLMILAGKMGDLGMKYHLTNPVSSTFGALCDSIEKALMLAPTVYSMPQRQAEPHNRILNKSLDTYGAYLYADDPVFGTANIERLVERAQEKMPAEITPGVMDFMVRSYLSEHYPALMQRPPTQPLKSS